MTCMLPCVVTLVAWHVVVVRAADGSETKVSPGQVVAIVFLTLLAAGCLLYGVMYYKNLKFSNNDAALETGVSLDTMRASNGPYAVQTVEMTNQNPVMTQVTVDINLLKSDSRASAMNVLSSSQVKLSEPAIVGSLPPTEITAAIQSYRSLIQQQTMSDINWMSPIETSRSILATRRETAKDEAELADWVSAVESSRTNQVFDTMRSDLDIDDSSEGGTVNL
ncbi:unnamed protein product [Aphanomyces euteiches]|uniref:Transmembrane protein n=1 Tax=Aphanomyces euteiches TaxID=100861 RepID=A0A6G0W5I2_9STRA|nr:hypothetical protein Ae201684_018512 [Aphanomyces euteiches]KAH9075902.1 hypothetical protein Ae201684P_012395 [Aphanomyces euteiches]KAH9146073.1 hypothetical protein AeRB84_010016 [Aphanomyces euteiches]